jgi:hypothetical protein
MKDALWSASQSSGGLGTTTKSAILDPLYLIRLRGPDIVSPSIVKVAQFINELSFDGTNLSASPTVRDDTPECSKESFALGFVSPGQINAQLPFGVPLGSANLTIRDAAGASVSTTITIAASSPGMWEIR